jgi:PAS domain S-box-containing protein
LGPGIFATVLSLLGERFLIQQPYSDQTSKLVVILLVGGFISWLGGRRGRDDASLRQTHAEREDKASARTGRIPVSHPGLEITQREQTERLLAESQKQNEFLAKLIRDSSQPVAVAYENGEIGLVNPAFEALTGYSAAELRVLGRPRLTPPDHHAYERMKLDEMRRTGQAVRYEKEYLRKDGTRIPVELLVHIVPATAEDPEYYYTFVTDITERKQARQELEAKVKARTIELTEANQKLAAEVSERARNELELRRMNRDWRTRTALLKAVNECTDEKNLVQRVCDAIVVDGAFPFAWVGCAEPGQAAFAFIACSDKQGTGLIDPVSAWAKGEPGYECAREAIQTGQPVVCHTLLTDSYRPETVKWAKARGIDSLVAMQLIADGITLGTLVVYSDRSEAVDDQIVTMLQQGANGLAQGIAMLRAKAGRLQAEAKLKKTESELARVARTLTVGELTASIAHEVNQPLAAMVINANACVRWLDAPTPGLDEARAAAGRSAYEGARAADVIARIRALLTKGEPVRAQLRINDVIREIIPVVQGEVRRREATMEIEWGRDLPEASMDRVQIQQMVMNLMINGLDAMTSVTDRPHVLKLSTGLDKSGAILISVQDNGLGLSGEQMGRLFDAFYTTKTHGLGMGLSICRSIAEAHGGRLTVESHPGSGAIFQFTLPVEKGCAE